MEITIKETEKGFEVRFNDFQGRTLPDRELAALYIEGVLDGWKAAQAQITTVTIKDI